jgi:putative ABC transport system permease protein
VAGVVALSIANTSDQAQARAEYVDQVPVGTGVVTDSGRHPGFLAQAEAALDAAGLPSTPVNGVPHERGQHARDPVVRGAARRLYGGTMSTLGVQTVVAERLPPVLPDEIDPTERAAADATLARGGVVLFSQRHSSLDRVVVTVGGTAGSGHGVSVAASVVDTGQGVGPASMVLAPRAARRLGLEVGPVAVLFDAAHADSRTVDQLHQTIGALDPRYGYVYVESGYQVANAEKVVLWILFGLAGILMLGGTLTATFLALSDARPDLATLSAVGASPRMRRAVAAAYAVAVGFVGAVLGAAVGFVPGIAVSYPLTRNFTGVPGPSHYLSIPWLEILGLVVLLPLVTAVVVGLLARSRLPLVARLD